MISLAFLLTHIKAHVETSLMNVIERDVVGGEIVAPPSTNSPHNAQCRNWLAVVLTRLVKEIDFESPGSELGKGPIVVKQLPAPEHVTEDIGLMLQSLPAHELEWAA